MWLLGGLWLLRCDGVGLVVVHAGIWFDVIVLVWQLLDFRGYLGCLLGCWFGYGQLLCFGVFGGCSLDWFVFVVGC